MQRLPRGTLGRCGPREGWLAFFVGFNGLPAKIIHVHELGPEREPPTPRERDWIQTSWGLYAPDGFDFEAPRWPVEIVMADEASLNTVRDRLFEFKAHELDFTNPVHRPYDWDSFILLLSLIDGHAAQQEKSEYSSQDRIVESKALREKLEDIASRVEDLRANGAQYVHSDWQDEFSFIATRENELKRTRQSYLELRGWMLSKAYCEAPGSIPEHLRAHHETWWMLQAQQEVPKLGGLTKGWSYELLENVDTHLMLLELPSSDLFGWVWGDCYSLLFIVPTEDLKNGTFENAVCDITN